MPISIFAGFHFHEPALHEPPATCPFSAALREKDFSGERGSLISWGVEESARRRWTSLKTHVLDTRDVRCGDTLPFSTFSHRTVIWTSVLFRFYFLPITSLLAMSYVYKFRNYSFNIFLFCCIFSSTEIPYMLLFEFAPVLLMIMINSDCSYSCMVTFGCNCTGIRRGFISMNTVYYFR